MKLIFSWRKSIWQILSCVLLSEMLLGGGALASDAEVFAKGNQAFHQGQWEDALKAYHALPKDFAVLYNLGSTYFKQGQLGKAIYYFKWALQEMPRDPDARFNLKYVREKTGALELARPWHSYLALPLNAAEGWWLAGMVLLILAVGLSLHRKWVLWILVLAVPVLAAQVEQQRFFGQIAIAGQEVKVYSSPSAEGILLFTLPEGSEVRMTHDGTAAENWAVVELGPQKKGWALKSNLVADARP